MPRMQRGSGFEDGQRQAEPLRAQVAWSLHLAVFSTGCDLPFGMRKNIFMIRRIYHFRSHFGSSRLTLLATRRKRIIKGWQSRRMTKFSKAVMTRLQLSWIELRKPSAQERRLSSLPEANVRG